MCVCVCVCVCMCVVHCSCTLSFLASEDPPLTAVEQSLGKTDTVPTETPPKVTAIASTHTELNVSNYIVSGVSLCQ